MNRRVLYLTSSRELATEVARSAQRGALEVDHAPGLAHALALLRRHPYAAILTDASLGDATWRDVLAHTRRAGLRCAVIVADRLADEELWAEVLDAGAYDLLAQPFDAGELRRVLDHACGEAVRPRPAVRSAGTQRAV
ncbi:MAG TPA: response regulator [Bryobacteraceae bacterium]|nr:response regulator [Bryobacteraceae bacterium]